MLTESLICFFTNRCRIMANMELKTVFIFRSISWELYKYSEQKKLVFDPYLCFCCQQELKDYK